MISDYNRYYGCVFCFLVDRLQSTISIRRLSVGVQGFYIVNETVPLYIKFSRTRKGPWSFNFQKDHQKQYSELVSRYRNCVTVLVCGKDGLVALEHDQLREILDDQFEDQESVTVRRKLGHMYSVKGTDGQLTRKIGRDSLQNIVGRIVGSALVEDSDLDAALS